MNPLILTIVVTIFTAVLESVLHYVRFEHTTPRTLRPALVGACLWAVRIAALHWQHDSAALIFAHSAAGGLVWCGMGAWPGVMASG